MNEVLAATHWWMSLPLAAGLAVDATVVAMGISASLPEVTRRQAFRLSWHFGLFQFLMPIIGWLIGYQAAKVIDGWDHWVAFALLAAVGGHMIYAALVEHQGPGEVKGTAAEKARDPTKGWRLIILSIGTSLDALAVGLALPLLQVNIWTVAPVIGLVTGLMVLSGVYFGRLAGSRFGPIAEVAGGAVLVGIGVEILLQGLATAV